MEFSSITEIRSTREKGAALVEYAFLGALVMTISLVSLEALGISTGSELLAMLRGITGTIPAVQ
jgi:Flp pilus assembly pilin Flp